MPPARPAATRHCHCPLPLQVGSVFLLPFVNVFYAKLGFRPELIGILAALKPWVAAPCGAAATSPRPSTHAPRPPLANPRLHAPVSKHSPAQLLHCAEPLLASRCLQAR